MMGTRSEITLAALSVGGISAALTADWLGGLLPIALTVLSAALVGVGSATLMILDERTPPVTKAFLRSGH